ncbi:P-loop NTPase family protein [Paenibacillus pini]|uniref:Uncharacterized protein n=1 Tax=Paenibacillus pini JCM 16418 TaxID=1236976 RepID=W7Z4D5_9BACL|nr:hypothetical protein [Paenibacillus pini]GAF09219.1 hypothetical protein JCM16418_3339 [Paenibacillus pini JCM 16418]
MLVFVEGLPGAGKSTNSGLLYRQFERNGFKTRWVHELDRPHPVLFFNEACLTMDEYQNWKNRHNLVHSFMDNLVQIREQTVGIDLLELSWNYQKDISEKAFIELQEKDAWNCTVEEYMDIALEKWRVFAKKAAEEPEQVVLLDSCIFQYQIFTFQLANAPKHMLAHFTDALWEIVMPLQPKLIMLYRNSVTDAIDHLRQVRGEAFFQLIWNRDRHRPYYMHRPDQVDSYFDFLADYHLLAQELYEKAPCPKLSIDVTSGDWPIYEHQLLSFCGLTPIQDTPTTFDEGEFSNSQLGLTLKVERIADEYFMIDPSGHPHKLHPRSSKEFYIRDLPVILTMDSENKIIMGGSDLISRWTETGLIYQRKDI